MNIYLNELKALRKSTIIWTCSITALAALYLSLYSGVAQDAEDFKKLLSGYSPAIRSMLGINLDYIATVLGFYAMIFSFILICGAIQAMNLGLSVLTRESRERTADFLYAKPVSRTHIVSAKLSACITMLLATNVVFLIVSLLIANAIKTSEFSAKLFIMVNLSLLFVQLILFSLGMVISVFFKKLKNVLPLSLGFSFGFYMIGALFATGENSDVERYFSPFRYFDTSYIVNNSSYELPYVIAGTVITVVSVITAYIIYSRKDIYSVS
jgi:ABC-2 type transport system permease protein